MMLDKVLDFPVVYKRMESLEKSYAIPGSLKNLKLQSIIKNRNKKLNSSRQRRFRS